MRKFGILSLALIVGLLVAAGSSFAATWTVPTDFGSITLAIANASVHNGDTIKVLPGEYTDSVTVDKNLNIIGVGGKDKTSIKSTASGNNVFTVGYGVTNVTISGFTISMATDADGVSIGLLGASNVKIQNCTVEHCAVGIGVYAGFLLSAANVTLQKNIVRYSTYYNAGTYDGTGILVLAGGADIPNVIISQNQIVDNDGFGIYVFGSSGTPDFTGMKIIGNTLVNNGAVDFAGDLNNHNWNIYGMGFVNAHGAITLSANKIQQLGWIVPEFYVSGGTAVFSGSGNKVYSSCSKTVAGPPSALTLP